MTENKLCIADQIGNYIKYAFDNLEIVKGLDNEELRERGLDKAMDYYKELRGDLILNGQSPRGMASGVVYTACRMVEWEMLKEGKLIFKNRRVTMMEVARVLNISQVSVRKFSYMIRGHFKLG